MSKNNVIPLSVRVKNGNSIVEDDNVDSVSLQIDSKNTSDERRSVMSFHNLNYSVDIKQGACGSCRASTRKQILSDVSGIMKPGLNAIMGPTGSGKSSLLDILAGRKDPAGLTGQVLINSKPLPTNFKRISGYVVQQDIVLGTLSVRENLWFSANLRLPRSVSKEQKSRRIDEILYDLGLTNCADTKVGNEIIRGISGGEKKRASIGMELITAPTVLFLDEPTTGLDASTANAVMILLKRLGNRGRTIILSIHQPRYSIFRLFDTLTLLSLGKVAYHGPYDQALPYFESLGYHCEEHNNPADFFLDVINGDSTALASVEDVKVSEEVVDLAKEKPSSLADQLNEKFVKSDIFESTQKNLSVLLDKSSGKKVKKDRSIGGSYATSFLYQFRILSKRAFQNVIRNPIASVGNLAINLFVGIIFGVLYFQTDDTAQTGTQNRFGVLFFITTNLMFGSISSIEVFVKERDIFIHEYVSGYYRVISYFLSKLAADLIPMRTISPIIFCSVTYWMVGLKADAGAFFTFLLLVLLTGYCATSIALFFSATFTTFAVASIFITLVFVFSILFSGLLLNTDTIFPWLAWIKYLSTANYGFSGLAVNEFRYQNFSQCAANNSEGAASLLQFAGSVSSQITTMDNQICTTLTGENFLSESLGIGENGLTDWDLWVNVVALSAITFGMFFLTYVQLRRTKVYT
ncbi:broad substrate specificity ATP-binding cassette transporter ABCG2-like isoform X2 [Clavelina lepadiformis]|uniref:broad substrate specificity ATP-binding cassette transporter ABCG2-like isoform X2 n=1 Tax=Clavelina lepadiformis TaxID=159417 RepID=UPI004041B25C